MRHAWLLSLALGAISLSACGVGYAYYAPAAPPPVRVEAFGVAPGPGYVWINGYWGYSGRNYVWTPGRWERPPRRGAAWVNGGWERHGNRWAYRRGHWR
ncbi:MAG TPA: hypothetical protein VH639_17830 [Bryobacteraceae bacterium]|jgi:hypothetical protein